MATATTKTTTPGGSVDLDWLAQRVDYRLYQDCVH